MSFWQRISTDASNAAKDVYSYWVLGDDAGKSAIVTLLYMPSVSALGMTFLEINGRAYVKSVVPGSAAGVAGVLPQDAVQLAVSVRPEWVQGTVNDKDMVLETEDTLDPNRLARAYVLHLEKKGARTTYDQLVSLISKQVFRDDLHAVKQHFLSPPTDGERLSSSSSSKRNSSTWNGPNIPSTICAPIINMADVTDGNTYLNFERRGSSSDSDSQEPPPIMFVFRRTRQRQSAEASCFMPASFRLDDECDLACSLVRRLAPTADMEAPKPDTWEELVHDGTDWLLGQQSMLPPKGTQEVTLHSGIQESADYNSAIPLDDFERVRAQKLATLRSRITAETMLVDRTEDVEAATVRAMIQKAVGLAFVRASKVVLGVSIHGGSGIVISRLSDGTWSAPSAIGTWGLGLGLQFGLEVAEYIFILQTHEAMQHFRRGGSYTVGGNMGVAIGGLGREAYGAASVGGGCGTDTTTTVALHDDEYNDETDDSRDERQLYRPPRSLAIAPIVAYAKSQGLYVGVSLEGSRIFTRKDINCRTYKFASGRNVTANDILSGKVPTPPEAEELYAALHSVEFTHEMSCLPRPPEILRKDSANAWIYDRSTLAESMHTSPRATGSSVSSPGQQRQPFAFFSKLSQRETEACDAFEAQFKNFMYGGVSVQRLLTDTEGRSDLTGKERRTLWLMLPEVGSLRLGFVSKLSDGEGAVSNKSSTQRARRDDPSSRASVGFDGDVGTVGSEDLTLDSALQTKDGSTIGAVRQGNVQLSDKHSVALTDVTILSQEPLVPIKFKGEDKTQHLRVISIQDVSGASLLFLANNFREAELLVCGLKLLLERETARLGVRGGLPITALGGRNKEGAMSPAAARGFRDVPPAAHTRAQKQSSGHESSVDGFKKSSLIEVEAKEVRKKWSKWGKQPGRDYMRGQAASFVENEESGFDEHGVPNYVHGQPIVKSIAKNVRLPLPMPLCRVLLLDSTSPVIKQWQKDRGDKNFDQSRWTFPPATPRELERHSSEHQLIASGSMCGAHRTVSFDRPRYGSIVRLSETYTVDADDPRKVSITLTEKNPRRGFSLKVRILLRACKDNTCDASVFADVRPVGKDMSNQAGVHKAFLLVLDEIKLRYGMEGSGLLAGFLSVVDDMTADHAKSTDSPPRDSVPRAFRRTGPHADEIKSDNPSTTSRKDNSNESGLVSFEDMLKTGRESPEVAPNDRPETPNVHLQVPEPNPAKRIAAKALPISDFGEFKTADAQVGALTDKKKDPVLIEVKPLPKIRLSLMPSPREEDEEDSNSSASPIPSKPIKKKKKASSSTSSKSTSRQAVSSSRISSGALKRR